MLTQMQTAMDIVEFDPAYQRDIENLVCPIQQEEFGVKITRDEQPDLLDIPGTFMVGAGNFWIALRDGQVVGTIGVVDIGDKQMALKKMFVKRNFRGKEYGVAAALMQRALQWCRDKDIRQIFLGTAAQMLAAHRFYEKNGFYQVPVADLPPNFPIVHVDTKFYRCDL